MKKKLIILIALFVFLVVWLAPASLIEGFMPADKGIRVSRLQGTLWSGAIGQIDANGWHFEELDYDLDLFSLLVGQVGSSVVIGKGDIVGFLEFTTDGEQSLSIANASIETNAQLLERFLPFPGISLNGDISTVDFSMDVKDKKTTLVSGLVTWNDAAVKLKNNLFKLGKFQIDWQTDTDTGLIVGNVIKTANALALEGKITLDSTGLFEFKGSISTKTQDSIYNTLILFADGKAKGDRLPIKFKKKLSQISL